MKMKDILTENGLTFYFFFKNEKWVAKSYKDIGALKTHLKLTEIEDEKKFIRYVTDGKKVFAYINPYDEDLEKTRVLSWARTLKQAERDFTEYMNDI